MTKRTVPTVTLFNGKSMGVFEEAVIYATQKHNGMKRKVTGIPVILHSMEVAQIISSITDDVEVMVAGILHDVVEDTEGTVDEIRELFGERVAYLVDSETENKYVDMDKTSSWKIRKEESLRKLESLNNKDVEILWLADKLSNIRSLANAYSEQGEKVWQSFNQGDDKLHLWYYKSIAQILEMHLNQTGAFKEYIKHINYIWPGTFPSEKEKYKKYREVSLENCRLIGKGAKSDVYRYNDELVIKIYNENNQYKDIEQENDLARQAFVAGIPTALSFGIVKVGNKYGSMFELMDSSTISELIAADTSRVDTYASIMAGLAKDIHNTDVTKLKLPCFIDEVYEWIDGGIGRVDDDLTKRVRAMIDELPCDIVIHGDFHTGNVMSHLNEYMLIDMSRMSMGHPILEISGMYMFYIAFGELDAAVVEDFMGFSYETSRRFFYLFLEKYFGTSETEDIVKKAALLAYVRLIRRCNNKGADLSEKDRRLRDYYMKKIYSLIEEVDSLLI